MVKTIRGDECGADRPRSWPRYHLQGPASNNPVVVSCDGTTASAYAATAKALMMLPKSRAMVGLKNLGAEEFRETKMQQDCFTEELSSGSCDAKTPLRPVTNKSPRRRLLAWPAGRNLETDARLGRLVHFVPAPKSK
jgi:hypothetical protein